MDINTGAQSAAMGRPAQGPSHAGSNEVQREAMDVQEQQAEEMMAGLEEAMAEAEVQEGGQTRGGDPDSALGQHVDESV